MRSITTRLILAFLVVSLVSVSLIVFLARRNTNQEFNSFIFNRNSSNLVSVLADYYQAQGNWNGVKPSLLLPFYASIASSGTRPMPAFTLANGTGRVVVAGPGYSPGQIVPPLDLASGLPIRINNQVVGTLLVGQNTFEVDPMEKHFIDRTGRLLWISAIGAAALALILGILLAYNITRPIQEMNTAFQSISRGELGAQVQVRGRDEISTLAASFNKMSADLQRSNNARKQMTADIAHDLRTPLSLIIGQAEAVHDGVLPPSMENFEIIREEADRLEKLVDDLRILSLADAGELSLDLQPISPGKFMQDVASIYQVRLKEKHLTLEQEISPDLPQVSIDSGRMTQVFMNILDNAFRYTPEHGSITLSARQLSGQVELAVQDTGSGVPESELERIFDRLFRLDASRQHQDGGSGLGLAIARSIVEMHQGRILAANQAGSGLKISILLPLSKV